MCATAAGHGKGGGGTWGQQSVETQRERREVCVCVWKGGGMASHMYCVLLCLLVQAVTMHDPPPAASPRLRNRFYHRSRILHHVPHLTNQLQNRTDQVLFSWSIV
jgi:hypothetical protein